MAKRNYKIYAGLGLDRYRVFRVLSILDTGVGPNYAQRTVMTDEMERCIRHGPVLDICGANHMVTALVGTVKLPVNSGNFLVHVEFIVCQSLVALVILGANFCGRYLEAIR